MEIKGRYLDYKFKATPCNEKKRQKFIKSEDMFIDAGASSKEEKDLEECTKLLARAVEEVGKYF